MESNTPDHMRMNSNLKFYKYLALCGNSYSLESVNIATKCSILDAPGFPDLSL